MSISPSSENKRAKAFLFRNSKRLSLLSFWRSHLTKLLHNVYTCSMYRYAKMPQFTTGANAKFVEGTTLVEMHRKCWKSTWKNSQRNIYRYFMQNNNRLNSKFTVHAVNTSKHNRICYNAYKKNAKFVANLVAPYLSHHILGQIQKIVKGSYKISPWKCQLQLFIHISQVIRFCLSPTIPTIAEADAFLQVVLLVNT